MSVKPKKKRGDTDGCRLWIAMLAAVSGLFGCGAPSEPAATASMAPTVSSPSDAAVHIAGSWRVVSVLGTPLNKKALPVTLRLDMAQQRLSGHDGCNNFMGAIAIGEKHQLSFGDVAATKKGCPPGTTPDGFYSALASVARFQYQPPELELMDAEGSVILTAKRDAEG